MTSARPVGRGTRTLWWGTVAATDILSLGAAAAAGGFDAIAVHPAMVDEAAGGAAEAVPRLADWGVAISMVDPVASLLPGAPAIDEVPERFRSYYAYDEEATCATAIAAGGSDVCVSGFLGHPVEFEVVRDAIGAMADRFAARGLRMLIEFMPNTPIPDLDTAVRIVEEVDSPALGAVVDTWHLFRTGGTTAQLEALPEDWVTAIQLADRPRDFATRPYVFMSGRVLPGEGDLPLHEWIPAILARSPQADVGLEVFSEELRRLSVSDAAAAAGASLRAVLPA